jgi:hypothetical protein
MNVFANRIASILIQLTLLLLPGAFLVLAIWLLGRPFKYRFFRTKKRNRS